MALMGHGNFAGFFSFFFLNKKNFYQIFLKDFLSLMGCVILWGFFLNNIFFIFSIFLFSFFFFFDYFFIFYFLLFLFFWLAAMGHHTHGQMALTKTMITCCNSINMTLNLELITQKTYKTQKDKKLIPHNNN